ncbi:hypothetical protein ABZW47_31300 [Streptomyces sp. NPDC004549]|uniref:hypothetical protein n=1 Tax=Streptomyces sp. NPDC004549 TaxID=3154283 RepID=UPI0033A39E4A
MGRRGDALDVALQSFCGARQGSGGDPGREALLLAGAGGDGLARLGRRLKPAGPRDPRTAPTPVPYLLVAYQRGRDHRFGTQTHVWLERGPLLLDITADQFGTLLPLRVGPVFLGEDRRWHDQFDSDHVLHPALPPQGDTQAEEAVAWLARALAHRPASLAPQDRAASPAALPRTK